MIDEPTGELASLYVLGLLTPEEAAAFETRMKGDEELAGLISRLEAAASSMARVVEPRDPPPSLRTRVLDEIRPASATSARMIVTSRRWMLAASVAVLAGVAALSLGALYWKSETESKALQARVESDQSDLTASKSQAAELQAKIGAMETGELAGKKLEAALQRRLQAVQNEDIGLRQQLMSFRQQVASLQARDALSQIKIATLTSLVQKTPKAVAVVAWDSGRQRGILKTANMPAAGAAQDYQLWIIDPEYKQPVSAGIFQPQEGQPSTEFQPAQPITKASKFAVSVEPKGGSTTPRGPIVLMGE